MGKAYKIEEGSMHDLFQKSRAKIQLIGGGYGNGKTTAAVVKGIMLAKDYPGSNGLVARSTYPKLSNTIRKEFREWIPKSWVARDVDSKVNLMELKNGSIINFSHVQQTGKGQESSTSNLLSATYDWIILDQIEDPEITEKDFLDLLGRLRGSTTYDPVGDYDDSMPTSGPRWFIAMCNPTRNWVYRKLVKPIHDRAKGFPNTSEMLNPDGSSMVALFESSTYDNANNLPADFITTQEAAYKGQMRSRFLLGEWGAYEGLVYPDYDLSSHVIEHNTMESYYEELQARGIENNILEAYDHGIAQPACYLFSFTDPAGNIFVLDGLYKKEMSPDGLSREIRHIRQDHGYGSGNYRDASDLRVLADPSIFRRGTGSSKTVGVTTAGMFKECGVNMIRANNDILNGIAKVQSFLFVDKHHRHPLTEELGSPRIFFSSKLDWIDREIVDYYWKKDTSGEYEDIPNDKNDHAMDAMKYLLTNRGRVATFRLDPTKAMIPSQYRRWREQDVAVKEDRRKHRYA